MRFPTRMAVPLAALALTLAACGSDDSSDSSGLKGDPIKLWTINPLSSTPSLTTEVPVAAKAAAKAINARGGIDGRPIEITTCDEKGDPNQASKCAREAVADRAVAVVGMLSNLGPSYVPVLESAGIPIVGGYPVAGPDLTSPNVYPLAGGVGVNLFGAADLAASLDAKKVGFAYQNFEGASQYVDWLTDGLDRLGIDLNQNVPIQAGAADMSSYAASLLRSGTDAVVITLGQADAVKLAKAVHEADPEIPLIVVGAAATSEEALASMGDAAASVHSLSPCKPASVEDDEDVKTWVKEMDAEDPKSVKNYNAALGYESVYLFEKVAKGLDEITPESISKALDGLTNYDTGLCGTISFDEPLKEFPTMPRIFSSAALFTQAKDGQMAAVTGDFINVFTYQP